MESLATELAGSNVMSAKGSFFGTRPNIEEILGMSIHSIILLLFSQCLNAHCEDESRKSSFSDTKHGKVRYPLN